MAIKRLNISTTQRTLPIGKPFDANLFNDTSEEISTDLAALALQWNNSLWPMSRLLPAGIEDSLVDAYKDGLDGRTFYVDASADTSALKIRYYNTTRLRPKTLKEVLDELVVGISQPGPRGPQGEPGADGGGGSGGMQFSTAAPYDAPVTFAAGASQGNKILFAFQYDFDAIAGSDDLDIFLSNFVATTTASQIITFGVFIEDTLVAVDPAALWDTITPVFEVVVSTATSGVYKVWSDSGTITHPTGLQMVLIAVQTGTVEDYGTTGAALNWKSTYLSIG